MKVTRTIKNAADIDKIRDEILDERKKDERPFIVVAGGTCGEARGSAKVRDAIAAGIEALAPNQKLGLRYTGCQGFCQMEPVVLVEPHGFWYHGVSEDDADRIIKSALSGTPVDDLLFTLDGGAKAAKEIEVPFFSMQKRLLLSQNYSVDPSSIESYIAIGGYSSLGKTFSMKPEEVVDEVKRAGLRGRGGGGFLTGRKWETVRDAQPGEPRYVICNADEGDPGAYMDRSLLEGNPHSVLEGMIVGAYAIGANEGYIYVRNEYPMAVKNIQIALEQARKMGLLGKNIMGSGFDFDVVISRGGGAFVCGESTALMASLEGQVGEPRAKYIHTAVEGLWGKPSCLNNVETWANVPIIIKEGVDKYTEIGTKGSKGTKIFSLVGKINNTGLVEVPMGVTLREIIFDIGGGIPGGKKFKAVQTGGPSGGCLPESMLDLPVDFDELSKVGSMMGSGGLIVMDENTCMVDVARYFTHFLSEESCGKCTPCREGVGQMLVILNRICNGEGKEGDVELLEEMSETILDSSLCALGGTAPNPVLSTLKYFRNEYDAHIKDKRCPGGVCKALIEYSVTASKCVGCMACSKVCPVGAISKTDKAATVKGKKSDKLKVHKIDKDKCIKCGMCIEACKFDSIVVE